jgi:hypothetical protein
MPASAASSAANWYARFAREETGGESPMFEEWASGVSTDAQVLQLIEQLPRPKQQPNLIFAVSRLLGAPEGAYGPWRDWLVAHWPAVAEQALVRATQTNEPRRCAVLLPALALIPGPLALLEVGASAGLCLYPDRYSYSYSQADSQGGQPRRLDPADGPSSVLLECATTGNPPIPDALPEIVWRAGIDLNPLDVASADDRLWLETLIWPEQHERRARIRAAMDIVGADPPRIVRGDAVDALPALAVQAPADATLVVLSSAAIVYLMPEPRARFIDTVLSLDARWISNEGLGIVPSVRDEMPGDPPRSGLFALGLDGHPLAWTGAHGKTLDWVAAISAPLDHHSR